MNFRPLITLFIATSVLFLISCNDKQEAKDIKALIDLIYSESNPFRNQELTDNAYSEKLNLLVLKAKEIEQLSIDAIPEEDRNNTKPYLVEGELFASLTEGYTSYSIQNISAKGDQRIVELEFTFDQFGSNEVWLDKAILIDENGWRLDNVVYGDKGKAIADLQLALSNYISECEVQKNVDKE